MTMLLNCSYMCPIIEGRSKISKIHNYQNKIKKSVSILCKNSSTNAVVTKSIGIEKYFQGKNIFLTGATGLVGKVLVENILRSIPVGKIYVLVRAEDVETAMDRLSRELINSELFESLRRYHGKYFQELIKEKLIPVVGDILEPNLGIDSDSARKIIEDVNVIVEAAAITNLTERYDMLIEANVKGPQALMSFAKLCKNLDILVHMSTVYVNGDRGGEVLESPLIKGENRIYDESPFPSLNIDDEMTMALKSSTCTSNYEITKNMKRLGLERARLFGWKNAYHMTKAMAEMVVPEIREDIPVLIIRPSVIESCSKQPIPGWIQGNRMYDPVIISYGKGQLPAYFGLPDAPIDIIPLDIVVNATIAAIAKHGQMKKSELVVYQLAPSTVNPLNHTDFFEYLYEYFSSDPLIQLENFSKITYFDNVARIKFFDNLDEFSNYTQQEMSRRLGIENGVAKNKKLHTQLKASVAYAEQVCKLYEFAGFQKGRFHSDNTQNLLSEMSEEERIKFDIDIKKINWRKYLQEVHIPGLRKYVINERRNSV